MENIDMLKIYKEALNDYYTLMNKYNSIDDKSIDNLKLVFSDQLEDDNIREGTVLAKLIDRNGTGYIDSIFCIETKQLFITDVNELGLLEIVKST